MTIVIDSSAIVAIVLAEPDADRLVMAITAYHSEMVVAAPTLFETLMVLVGKGYEDAPRAIEPLLKNPMMSVAPFTADLVAIAQNAFLRFGKGRHPAGLNYGECMAYALAKSLDAPLLFKGGDFALTDIVPAL